MIDPVYHATLITPDQPVTRKKGISRVFTHYLPTQIKELTKSLKSYATADPFRTTVVILLGDSDKLHFLEFLQIF